MNELLAQAYGTGANIEANTGVEKTAEAVLLEELEKIATAEGIDLNEFDDNDIMEIIGEALGETQIKTASAEGEEVDVEEGEAKLAEADFLGRTMAHAFYDELTSIQHTGVEKTAGRNSDNFLIEKTAAEGDIDPELMAAFEEAAVARANEIIDYLDTGEVKQSSAAYDDEELDGAITERAGELLAENGYDVDAIATALTEAE
tara:strand:- start:4929 stop:5537 length:609 start_codon:yes stop_codon:yes gene_type:complete